MKLDRLMGILTLLLRTDSITAPALAERFEVSRRTISRDIDALCMAGIPVITRQGGGGGISIAQGFKLDKSVLTADELSSIIAALKGIGSVSDQSRTERTLDKLSLHSDAVISLRESIVIDLASFHKGSLTAKIECIKNAIRDTKVIGFDYYYEKGECHRCIEPYFVVFQWMNWYVFGFCRDRDDWRMFKLGRLWNLSQGEDSFTPREIPPERRDLNASFTDHLELTALFEPSVKYQLIESYGLDCFSVEPDGRLRFEISYTNESYIISWLLGFGDKVTVLEPPSVIRELRRIAAQIVGKYE